MAEKNKRRIIRCSQCGSLLDKKTKMNRIFKEADDALDRFYNKQRRKNGKLSSKGK